MKTKRNKMLKKRKTRKNKHSKSKKWVTAVDAAQITLKKTGSLLKARMALRAQASRNARKLFGSVGQNH
jgi:hypothetical protein